MNKIKVFIKYPHRAPYAAWIANKLESLQKIVGGYIETATLENGLLPDLWPAAGKKGEDRISLKKTAQLMAEMFCAKPCQLSNLHKGIARRLPLRCSFTPEFCDHRSVVECWERLLGYPTMADDIKEE